MSPVHFRDGLAGVGPVRRVRRFEWVTSGRRPGDVRPVVVTGNELASVVSPGQRFQLLTGDVGLNGGSGRAVPQDDQATRVPDQDLLVFSRMDQQSLDGARIDFEIFWRVLHDDVLVDDVFVDGKVGEVEHVDVATLGAEENLFVLEVVAQDGDLLQSTVQSDGFLFLQKQNKNIFTCLKRNFFNEFLIGIQFHFKDERTTEW